MKMIVLVWCGDVHTENRVFWQKQCCIWQPPPVAPAGGAGWGVAEPNNWEGLRSLRHPYGDALGDAVSQLRRTEDGIEKCLDLAVCASQTGSGKCVPLFVVNAKIAAKVLNCAERSKLPGVVDRDDRVRSEEHTSELQSLRHLVCRLLLENKNDVNGKRPGIDTPNAAAPEKGDVTVV